MEISNPIFEDCIKFIKGGKEVLNKLKIDYNPKDIIFQKEREMFYYIPSIRPQKYIASFDVDWTVTYSQKHLFPKDEDDLFIIPNRREKLLEFFKRGFTIVFFTNQYAKSTKEKTVKMRRMTTLMKKLRIPCYLFVATGKDEYRKPELGMWRKMNEIIPNIKFSFYCGDAAGRPQDFSDSDKVFAEKAGISFYTPEEIFLSTPNVTFTGYKNIVIFVGMPGSGKSSYYYEHLAPLGYIHINQDELKTKNKVIQMAKRMFTEGKSMVIDSTNPSQEDRQVYYDLANNYGYTITVLYFIRDGVGWNKLRENSVPMIVYHIYFKKLDPPTKENTPGDLVLIS